VDSTLFEQTISHDVRTATSWTQIAPDAPGLYIANLSDGTISYLAVVEELSGLSISCPEFAIIREYVTECFQYYDRCRWRLPPGLRKFIEHLIIALKPELGFLTSRVN